MVYFYNLPFGWAVTDICLLNHILLQAHRHKLIFFTHATGSICVKFPTKRKNFQIEHKRLHMLHFVGIFGNFSGVVQCFLGVKFGI